MHNSNKLIKMVNWVRKWCFFYLTIIIIIIIIIISNIFMQFMCIAQLIPEDEVKTLQVISQKLENPHWNISQSSCSDGGQSFNRTFSYNSSHSTVICDCSFSRNNVCHVTNIQLRGLNLTGFIPEEFGNLAHLQEIDLTRNYINGIIPKSLSKIPLVSLTVSENRITGAIPEEIGQITTLHKLSFEDNQLEGPLTKSLGNLRNLRSLLIPEMLYFDVSGFPISVPPPSIDSPLMLLFESPKESVYSIKYFLQTYFNGTIPETFVNLKNVTQLRLNGNMISGKVPDFIGNLTSLISLDIQGTSMKGPIPSSLSLFSNLQILRISDLNTASLPFPNLTDLTSLKFLILRNCKVTGQIPDYVGNLVNLTQLDLSYNELSGPVPESLGKVKPLKYLFLTNNSLSGALPQWILNSKWNYDLSYNNFSGSAPSHCQLSNLNLVASFSSAKSNEVSWCFMKDLPCSTKPQHHSLFINCGGNKMRFEGNEYNEDTISGGPSIFFASGQNWAYSSTGVFQFKTNGSLITHTSLPNVTGIYQTARLAPLSLKYYGLCMRQGSYTVKLHFAEIMFTDDRTFSSNGRRIFDVSIQGNEVLKDFNIAAEARSAGIGITKEFKNVYVNGSTLEIYLYWAGRGTTAIPQRSVYGPLISRITVTPNFKVSTGLSGGAIAGIVVASACAILASIMLILWMTGYFAGKDHELEELRRLDAGYFTLRQIKAATDDFSQKNIIGEGGFGAVYEGVLPDGNVIAVKKLSSKSKQGNREFVTEIGMISALQHPNLVKLYGYCIEGKELLLVYEYMENNSLARALFGKGHQKLHLEWKTRTKICLGIARGLAYLHEGSRLKIVHRDIKATNVLLDKDLNAKISDFGLAKLYEEENTHISTRVAGTIGYMAPEYAMRGCLTAKADVYSFGVVILEIVNRTSNTRYMPKENFIFLLDWAYVLLEQGNLLELVDPTLGTGYSEEEALRLLNIALLCTNPSPTLRPTMSSVVSIIEGQLPVQARIVKHSNNGSRSSITSFQERVLE